MSAMMADSPSPVVPAAEEEVKAKIDESLIAMGRVQAKKLQFARKFLREFVLYVLFLVVFCLVSDSVRDPNTFYANDAIRETLLRKSWDEQNEFDWYYVSTTEDYYTWLQEIFFKTLRPVTWYNGDTLTEEEKQYVDLYNYLVGAVRIRQVRIKPNENCVVDSEYEEQVKACYGEYSSSAEETSSYGIFNQTDNSVHSAFNWTSSDTLCESAAVEGYCKQTAVGATRQQYGSSGYVFDFSRDFDVAIAEVQELMNNSWIDLQTRAVFLDLTLYNPNFALLVTLQLLVEVSPTGLLVVTESFRPMSTMGLDTKREITVFVAEIILCVVVVLYTLSEFWEFSRYYRHGQEHCMACQIKKARIQEEGLIICAECGRDYDVFRLPQCPNCTKETEADKHSCWKGYFTDVWNLLDFVSLTFFYVVFVMRFQLRGYMPTVNFNVGDEFLFFYPVAWSFSLANWLNSVNAILMFAKCFKYIAKFKSLRALFGTFINAATSMFYFVSLFLMIMVAFALSFNLAFGSDVREYRDFNASFISLWIALFGEFDFEDLWTSNRLLSPLLFPLFQVSALFIFATMFISILTVSLEYSRAASLEANQSYIGSALKLLYNEMVFKLSRFYSNTSFLLPEIKILLRRLKEANLTQEHMDDVQAFRSEVEHNPYNTELFSQVLTAFRGRVDRPMTEADFSILRQSVLEYRQKVKARAMMSQEGHIWDSTEEGKEQSGTRAAELVQRYKSVQHSLTMTTEQRKVNQKLKLMDTELESLAFQVYLFCERTTKQ